MAEFRSTIRSTDAYDASDTALPGKLTLDPDVVVEVLSEDDPTFTKAKHLGKPLYIRREDTVQVSRDQDIPGEPAAAITLKPDSIPCRRCGSRIAATASHCTGCGASVLEGGIPEGEFAGFWIRFGASLVDSILVGTTAAVVVALLVNGEPSREALLFIAFVLSAAYFVTGYALGATLGALFFGLRIVTVDGGEPGFVRGFIRWIVAAVSGLVLYLGYFWMLWDPKKQTWHDKAAGTFVVRR